VLSAQGLTSSFVAPSPIKIEHQLWLYTLGFVALTWDTTLSNQLDTAVDIHANPASLISGYLE
jgi:hypothetical protein